MAYASVAQSLTHKTSPHSLHNRGSKIDAVSITLSHCNLKYYVTVIWKTERKSEAASPISRGRHIVGLLGGHWGEHTTCLCVVEDSFLGSEGIEEASDSGGCVY